jgi:methyl-accepting chemotaxis protein
MQHKSSDDAALTDRLKFMKLDGKAAEHVRKVRPIVERELPGALDKFYDQVRATPELRKFFANESMIGSARSAQINHWATITSGDFDERYHAKVRRIGQTHARIGLEPRWYIGAYSLLTEALVTAVVKDFWPKGILRRKPKDGADEMAAVLASMLKAIYLDMDLSISVYIDAAEEARARQQVEAEARERTMAATADEARKKGEAEALAKERDVVVGSIGAGLARLAEKDLTHNITEELPPAYATLQNNFNLAMRQLASAFDSVNASTDSVHTGAEEIAIASNDLCRRTEQQAASLEETAAALDEITTTVRKTADGAKIARESVAGARRDALRGGEIVRKAVDAMGKIEKSSQQISQIIGVIDEIAFQTNLLALNAGVEAARAGDAGRGFAVVASEVRALAQRSAEAAKEIKGLISTSTQQVSEGVSLVAETGHALSQIEAKVSEITDVVSAISASAEEQATSLQQVNSAVNQMDQVTQQNAAMAEQANAASQSLAQSTDELARLIAQFRIRHDTEVNIRRELEGAAPHAFSKRASARAEAEAPSRSQRSVARPKATRAPVGRRAAAVAEDEDWKEF